MSTPRTIDFAYRCAMSDSQELAIFTDQGLSGPQLQFCELVADADMTIEDARKALGWSTKVYRRMRLEQPAFDMAVARAREMAQDVLVDKLPEIARTEPDVQRARLMSDNIKWIAARIRPRLYGDKLDLNVTANVSIAEAMAAAKARVTLRPMCDPADIIDGQVIDSQNNDAPSPIDKQSTLPGFPDIFG
jgi:hypothetical protein